MEQAGRCAAVPHCTVEPRNGTRKGPLVTANGLHMVTPSKGVFEAYATRAARADELRCQGLTYQAICEAVGYGTITSCRRAIQRYRKRMLRPEGELPKRVITRKYTVDDFARAGCAARLRQAGWLWDAIAARLNYSSGSTACEAVSTFEGKISLEVAKQLTNDQKAAMRYAGAAACALVLHTSWRELDAIGLGHPSRLGAGVARVCMWAGIEPPKEKLQKPSLLTIC